MRAGGLDAGERAGVLPTAAALDLPGDPALREPGAARTAVLLCHGFTGSPFSMAPLARDLAAAGVRAVVPRLPGHGTTWQQMGATGWPDWCAEVDAALADLRADGSRAVVAGLSMGGALALHLAIDRPGDVAALVLVNPAVLLADPRLALLPLLARLRPSMPGIGSDTANGADEHAYDHVPLPALASSLAGYASVRARLHEVVAPLVVLRSAVDHVVPAASSAAVLAGVSSTSVREVVLPRSFHVATLDHDAATITATALEVVAAVERGEHGGPGAPAPEER